MRPATIPDPIEEEVRRALRGIPRPWRDAVADQMLRGHRRKGKSSRDPDDGGVPVEPNNPRGLQGGAAAPLELDD